MEIMLITSMGSEEVHGTDNGKKTGCGMNMMKNAMMFKQIGVMEDLKELTCEKCKTAIAKKLIKADKKEMARLIKEEKVRAKKGIEEDGIVPLGNTQAKMTKAPEPKKAPETFYRAVTPEPEIPAEPVAPVVEPEVEKPAAPMTIPGTGVAIDSDLAAFAINVPKEEPEQSAEKPEDDFLAQFAINKPVAEEEEEAAPAVNTAPPVQDDFLAQFAIPSPVAEEAPAPAASAYNETPVVEETPAVEEASSYMSDFTEAPAEPSYMPEPSYAPVEEAAPAVEDAVQEDVSDDDIMKMFSISSGAPESGMEILSDKVPEEKSIYDNDESVVDVEENQMTRSDDIFSTPSYESYEPEAEEEAEIAAEPVAVMEEPESEEAPVVMAEPEVEEESSLSEWESVANQLFGAGMTDEMPGIGIPEAPVAMAEPEIEEAPVAMAEPEIEEAPVAMAEPEVEEAPVAMAEPEVEEAPVAMAEPEIEEAPIAMAEPEIEEAPVAMAEPEEKKIYDMDSIGEFEMNHSNKHVYSAPVFADEVKAQPAPVQQTPVQPAPVQPQMNIPSPEQPMIVNVPQITGYDMNGQPVYTYVPSQIVGYDQNGQPMFAPVQPMNYQNMGVQHTSVQPVPVQQTPVQPAPVQQAPVQPAPVQQTPVQPAPVQQTPVQPAPVQQTPVQPAPVQQTPVQPAPVQPAPVQQAPVQPVPMPQSPVQPQGYTTPQVNISKVGANARRPMSQHFVNAIASSRERSQHNILDAEYEKNKMPMLDSIEDVLSQMGDDSAKRKKQAELNVPVFQEYKAPSRSSSSAKKTESKPQEPSRPLTKAELKALKKQEKIDQKFKKDLAKRGF